MFEGGAVFPLQKLLSYSAAATHCGVSKDTLRRLVEQGLIQRIMVAPNCPRISEADLAAYLERQRQTLSPNTGLPSAGKKRGRGRPRKDSQPAGAPKRGRPRKSVASNPSQGSGA